LTLFYRHPASYDHDTGQHPENAGRIEALDRAIDETPPTDLEIVEAPLATHEQIERVHGAPHVAAIEALCRSGGGMIDFDTVASEGSWEAVLRASGAGCEAVDRLLGADAPAAFCALRPPGHHAERNRSMGFCLFNHIAVAAEHAIVAHGAARVLILDWDVHHGNGTEEIFRASDRVLYVSIHQSPLYPGTGPASYVGEGAGEGYTVNLPVPAGSGSAEFTSLVEHVVVPLAREFQPALIAVSAGFDAHRADPLASCLVDEGGYAAMAAAMSAVGRELGAPVLACLEGGYDPSALASSVLATLSGLTGEVEGEPPASDPEFAAPYRARLATHWRLDAGA